MTLDTFVALIALDKDRRKRFLIDPEAELETVGLNSGPVKGLIPTMERLVKAMTKIDYPPPNNPLGGKS